MNTIAKGLLRGVGFLANAVLDGMNQHDREKESASPVMDAVDQAVKEQIEFEQEMTLFNQIHGTDHIVGGPGKIGW